LGGATCNEVVRSGRPHCAHRPLSHAPMRHRGVICPIVSRLLLRRQRVTGDRCAVVLVALVEALVVEEIAATAVHMKVGRWDASKGSGAYDSAASEACNGATESWSARCLGRTGMNHHVEPQQISTRSGGYSLERVLGVERRDRQRRCLRGAQGRMPSVNDDALEENPRNCHTNCTFLRRLLLSRPRSLTWSMYRHLR
jgi:hypothetical protein